jgi:hypothetical protein
MNTVPIQSKLTAKLLLLSSTLLVVAIGMLAARIPHLVNDFRARGIDALGDFQYYYYAFTVVLKHPQEAWTLYDNQHIVAFLQHIGIRDIGAQSFYGYPPQFAVLFSWLALFDATTARTIWSVMSLMFLLVGLALTLHLAYRGKHRGVLVLLIALALLCRPIVDEVYWGQSNALLFFLLAATFFCIERGNRYAAGAFLASAIAFKITPLAIAGLLLLRQEWRTVIATVIFSIVIAALTAVQTGWRVMLHFFLSDLSRLNEQILLIGGAPFNSSFKGALQTLFATAGMAVSTATLGTMSTAFAAAVCLLAAYLVFKRSTVPRMDYALATATMLVASPVLESVHLVVVLIPLLILVGTALEQSQPVSESVLSSRMELALVALTIVLLMFSPRFVSYTVAALLIYALCVARYFPRVTGRDRLRKHD